MNSQNKIGPLLLAAPAWRSASVVMGLGMAVLLVGYWSSAESAVHLWSTSSAYNYGFLIAPISIYLLWTERATLALLTPEPSFLGLVVTIGFGAAWLIADLMGINEGRHLAFVGMLQGIFLTGLGWRVYARLSFPLLYLWLMVPTGDFLVEPLQNICRDGAVLLLKVFAIPVFVESWTIEVPAGTFIVERGCSGLNFILASSALALLFAKLNYASWRLRLLTVVVSLVVAVIANIARIFLIVAITQWSDRRIDIADDHLLFGWIFFGIAMFACMWFGARFAQPIPALAPPARHSTTQNKTAWGLPILLIAALAVFPIFSETTNQPAKSGVMIIDLPEVVGDWRLIDDRPRSWRPGFAKSDGAVQGSYMSEGKVVDVAVSYCSVQWRGCEATAAENRPVDPDSPIWRQTRSEVRSLVISRQPERAVQTDLLDGEGRLVYSWYESAGCLTSSRLQAKLCTARLRLQGKQGAGAFIAMSSSVGFDRDGALAALDSLAANWPKSPTLVRTVPR